jgi:UPF0271 protein
MTLTVDLNADMGESFGPWGMGDDAALLRGVSSANVACGMHAGDWDTMAQTMRLAQENGVGIGAHPGFADLQGFGRRKLQMPLDSLANLVAYQLGAAQAMARGQGGRVRHLKLHGALANMAAEDLDMALACYRAALAIDPDLIIMVLAGTQQQAAAAQLGCRTACEIFADRAYNDDATLVDRALPGAVIHAPQHAAARVVQMVQEGAILSQSGARIETRIDTICLHGDTPAAVQIAQAVQDALQAAGVGIKMFEGAPL